MHSINVYSMLLIILLLIKKWTLLYCIFFLFKMTILKKNFVKKKKFKIKILITSKIGM